MYIHLYLDPSEHADLIKKVQEEISKEEYKSRTKLDGVTYSENEEGAVYAQLGKLDKELPSKLEGLTFTRVTISDNVQSGSPRNGVYDEARGYATVDSYNKVEGADLMRHMPGTVVTETIISIKSPNYTSAYDLYNDIRSNSTKPTIDWERSSSDE